MKEQKTRPEVIYWGIFILVCIGATQLIFSFIELANRETTQFESQTALAVQKNKLKLTEAVIQTSEGDITLRLMRKVAPVATANFIAFANSSFYDGIKVHRVVEGELFETGDPLSREKDKTLWGTGGPGYVFESENMSTPIKYGMVGYLNRGREDTNGSQFFIVANKDGEPKMEGKYTIFAEVTGGQDIVDRIASSSTDINEHPLYDIVVKSIVVY